MCHYVCNVVPAPVGTYGVKIPPGLVIFLTDLHPNVITGKHGSAESIICHGDWSTLETSMADTKEPRCKKTTKDMSPLLAPAEKPSEVPGKGE